MTRILPTVTLMASLTLGACATPYGPPGFTGGVAAAQMSKDVWRISARGNGFTSGNQIHDYVMLKAAETAFAAGYQKFGLLAANDATSMSQAVVPGYTQVQSTGNFATLTHMPARTVGISKPGADILVKGLPVSVQADGFRVFDALDVIRTVGARVRR